MAMKIIKDLRTFLSLLRKERELLEVDIEVDPYLDIAEIHRRVIALKGPAILFKNVKGSRFPVVTNLFGSAKQLNLTFGRLLAFVAVLVNALENLITDEIVMHLKSA